MFHSAGVELGGRELDLGGGGAVFKRTGVLCIKDLQVVEEVKVVYNFEGKFSSHSNFHRLQVKKVDTTCVAFNRRCLIVCCFRPPSNSLLTLAFDLVNH